MRSRELMIGDWVATKDYKFQVTSVAKASVRTNYLNRVYNIAEKELQPIPLTAEILEKNGFKDYTEIFEYQFEEDGEKYRFYLKKMYNANGVCDAWGTNIGGVLPSLITYVHELQRALRCCGLNDLADGFKV